MLSELKVKGSWAVSRISYDDSTQILSITMVDAPPKSHGEVLRYAGVPKAIWDAFQKAESTGGFFNRHIRNDFPLVK